ncbi:MAG: winged helix-turn-helix transcriptional regulator [Thermoplasmata archaeon]|nr:winged helix-turn-helix transcriptional regulator [Thermoplasmata archaeon]
MNQNRRKIFQYLCAHPCLEIGPIAKGIGLSRSSIKWHLDKLIDSGYVQIHGEKIAYCPYRLISRKNIGLFSILARDKCMAVYKAILQNPGSDPSAIKGLLNISPTKIRSCLSDLMEMDLISLMKDGKYTRYFPTERYNEAIREEKITQREFVRYLVNKLSMEHLKPEIIELKGTNIVISINVLGQVDRIIIPHIVQFGLE